MTSTERMLNRFSLTSNLDQGESSTWTGSRNRKRGEVGIRLTSTSDTAAGLKHTRGGSVLDRVDVLAGAGVVSGVTDTAIGDGVFDAGLGLAVAGNDLLGAHGRGEGDDGEGELHFGG